MIRNLFICLATISVFVGCGAREPQLLNELEDHSRTTFSYADRFNFEQNSLWELKIEQRGNEKFSGIVALKKSANLLTLVLLDPTGLKLFEESISNTGAVSRLQTLSFFDNHQLPEYLGKVIYRTFNVDADTDSCSGKLYTLCLEEESMQLKKKAQLGPFMVWNVIYSLENDSTGDVPTIEYNSPWIGTSFYLKPL